MNGTASATTFSSDVSTQVTTPSTNSSQILSAYRNMTDEMRETLRNNMEQIDNDLLIEKYNALDDGNRKELYLSLTAAKKQIILSHYMNEFNNSVMHFERLNHPANDIVQAIAQQLRSFQRIGDTQSNVKSEDILDIAQKTTSFIQTPPFNQDMTPNSAFAERSQALSAASSVLRKSGTMHVLKGLLDTFMTLMWIGASVLLGLHLGGIIGSASTLIHAVAPLSFAVNGYFTINSLVSGIGHFRAAHKSFSLTNKTNELVNAMQQPASAATQESTIKPSM